MLKRIIFSLFVGLFLFMSSTTSVSAASWYQQDFPSWYTKVYDNSNPDEVFGERYVAANVQWIIYSLVAQLLHSFDLSPSDSVAYCVMSAANNQNCADQVLRNIVDKLTPTSSINTSNPIAAITSAGGSSSGLVYLKDSLSSFSFAPVAHAQEGFGYVGLNPVQGLWRATRNIMYFLMVLAIIIMAFLIMFRVKVAPQVVISIQSAIPKVAMALVLMTFSYAIAGLMIDLMYAVIGLISLVFVNSGITDSDQTWAGMYQFMTQSAGGFFLAVLKYWAVFIYSILYALVSGGILGTAIAAGLGLGAAVAPVITAVILGILLIMFLLVFIRVLIMGIKTYVNILLLVVTAPIQIGFGVIIPGGLGFGSWLRNLISNLAVYPVAATLLALSFIFLAGASSSLMPDEARDVVVGLLGGWSTNTLRAEGTWIPPFTFGSGQINLLWLIVSFAIFSLIPKSADLVKGLISGKGFAYGTAMNESTGFVTGTFGFLAGAGVAKPVQSFLGNLVYDTKTGQGLASDTYYRVKRRVSAIRGRGRMGGPGVSAGEGGNDTSDPGI